MRTNLRSVHAILHLLHNHVVFTFLVSGDFLEFVLIAKLHRGNKEVSDVG